MTRLDGQRDAPGARRTGIRVLLDVVTNPEEVSLPPKVKPGQAWGFAIAKLTETLESRSS